MRPPDAMRRRFRSALFLGALLLPGGATALPASAPIDDPPPDVWSDPDFRRQFIGSYGIHPDVEPRVSPLERDLLARIFPLMGSNPREAARLLEKETKPNSSAMLDYTLANLRFQEDRLDDALRLYRVAVEKFPAFRRAWKNLGLAQARQGNYADAVVSFTRLIELGGGDATIYGLLAYGYAGRRDFLAAESAYRQALLLQPDNDEWRLGLARCALRQQKHEEAAGLLDGLLEKHSDRADLWLLQANAYIGMKQPLKAAENLEIVSRLGKGTIDALNLLGDIYVNESLMDLAADAYVRAIGVDPAQPPGRALRAAEALAARGALAAAGTVAARAKETLAASFGDDDRRRVLKLEARLAVAGGDGGEAVRVLEEVVALDPLDGDALLLLGQHYARSGDAERALMHFERAASLEAYEAAAKVRQAQILVGQEKYQQALPLLRRAQEIKPQDDVARYLEQVERLARARR